MNLFATLLSITSFVPINPELTSFIGKIVEWIYSIVGSFGITIIIFTVCLKIITLPLDIWQKISMKKNSLRNKKLQPLMEKIDKQYAGDNQRIAQEKQKVYKKYGATGRSMFGSCLMMLLTFGIFIVMFQGLQAYATYGNQVIYDKLIDKYTVSYDAARDAELTTDTAYQALLTDKAALEVELRGATSEEDKNRINESLRTVNAQIENYALPRESDIKCIEIAQKAVGRYYPEIAENFLWIHNLYRADTWGSFFPTYNEFVSGSIGVKGVDSSKVTENTYNVIRNAVMEANSGYFDGNWNGLLILPILSIALSFFSMWITQRTQNVKGAQIDKTTASTNKMMMFVMPAMMAFFAFQYTAAFALYMVCNSFISMIVNICSNKYIDNFVTKKFESESIDVEPSYSRKRK